MKIIHSICISTAALLLLTVVGHTQTVINSVPYTITAPGNYVLGASLTYSLSGTAITVNAHNVTIDLNGHYLYNPTLANSAFAIRSDNKGNITVKNGQIIGFYVGVYLDNTTSGPYNAGHLVESVRLTNCGFGIFLTRGTTSVFQNNQISTTLASGTEGIGFFSGGGTQVSGNVVSGYSTNSGISSNGGNYIDGNTLSNCSTGISMAASDKYRANTTFNCTTAFNGGTALFAENN